MTRALSASAIMALSLPSSGTAAAAERSAATGKRGTAVRRSATASGQRHQVQKLEHEPAECTAADSAINQQSHREERQDDDRESRHGSDRRRDPGSRRGPGRQDLNNLLDAAPDAVGIIA